METRSFQFKLWSHPNHLLSDHCRNVWQIANHIVKSLSLNSAFAKIEDIEKLLQVATLFHDFGKATPWFQNYVRNLNEKTSSKDKRLRHHSLISAIMTYSVLKQIYPDNLLYPAIGFIIVSKHHGDLEEYANLFTILDEEKETCQEQIGKIDYFEFSLIVSPFGYSEYVKEEFLTNAVTEITSGKNRRFKNEKELFSKGYDEHYYLINLCYSILLQADKTDAIFKQAIDFTYPTLNTEHIITYKHNVFKKDINLYQLREAIFKQVENSIEQLNQDTRILSINAPTGTGKTITALYAGLKLLEKFGLERIIYCLPYTSIIDQNHSVFQQICHSAGLPETTDLLLKHHHLSDIFYHSSNKDDYEYKPDEALHFIEGWESRIIVTTFVQFLMSLITEKNSTLRRFNKFNRAVIVLDEIQTIPHHYWLLIKEVLKKTTTILDARIILVTATLPLIFSEEKGEIIELVKDKQEYFTQLSRIQLNLDYFQPDGTSWDNFLQIIANLCQDNCDKNLLIIMNTIRSAQRLFYYIEELNLPHRLEFLSSQIIPKERLDRIERVRKQLGEQPTVLVSTQLVEVGVDIDFDIVIRDFAPLDSIFQTCGRCNREMRLGNIGQIYLFSIKDTQGKEMASYIYDPFLLNKTRKVLTNRKTIQESDFSTLAYNYYREVSEKHSQQESIKILEALQYLRYSNENGKPLSRELKIIDEDYKKSVFIEIDEEAHKIWERYVGILNAPDNFEKRALIRKIWKELQEYIINVSPKCLPHEPVFGVYHLPFSKINEYYDQLTGFNIDSILQEESVTQFF